MKVSQTKASDVTKNQLNNNQCIMNKGAST